jgi:hypothetical protein
MALSTDFTNQVSDSMDFVEFTNDTVVMVAEKTGKLRGERVELLLSCCTFG